ncbi:MAG: amino acid adenylation domain-containing protein [Blastocatellia bacterium]
MPSVPIEGFNLSPQQKRIWLLQSGGGGYAYQARCAVLIEGHLDSARLDQAIRAAAVKHEIIRTTFRRLHGMDLPLQVISDELIVDASESRWHEGDAPDQAGLREIMDGWSDLSFDLEHGPLLHARLIHFSDSQHLLLISLHALCGDEFGLTNLAREISGQYLGVPPADTMQYADISEWLVNVLQSKQTEPGRQFWRKQKVAGLLIARIPGQAGDAAGEFTPRVLRRSIEAGLLGSIKGTSNGLGVPLSTLLLGCWQALLLRLSFQPAVVVGAGFSGRKYPGLDTCVGNLIRYLPVACEVAPQTRLPEFLSQLSAALEECYKWQDTFSWEHLTADDEVEPRAAFFPFLFHCVDELPTCADGAARFSVRGVYACTERFHVRLCCIPEGERLSAEFHYDAAVFHPGAIQRLAEQFEMLLSSIIAQPDSRLCDLNILSPAEREALILSFNDTKVDRPPGRYFHQMFEARADRAPDQICVETKQGLLTYRELDRRANQLSRYLRRIGVKPDTPVGVCLRRSGDLLVSILGVLKAGGVYVPLDPGNPKDRLDYVLQDAAIFTVLTDDNLAAALPDHTGQVLCLDSQWDAVAQESRERLGLQVEGENLAYIIYTSGSTGRPKGVMVTQRGLANYLLWCADAYGIDRSVRSIVHSPIGFDLTLTSLFSPLIAGGRVLLLPDEDGVESLAAALRDTPGPNLVKITPSHLEALAQLLDKDQVARGLNTLVIGGEALFKQVVALWGERSQSSRTFNEYGPTETVVGCCVYEVRDDDKNDGPVPIGRPIANTQIYVLDSQMRPAATAVPGELYIGGLGLARGYWNQPSLTAERFIPDPFSGEPGSRLYKTGDIARHSEAGQLEFIGRTDHQVKIRGFRIELGEIEAVLSAHPRLREVTVLAREDGKAGKNLVAYVVPCDGYAVRPPELRAFLQSKLPDYMIPWMFVSMERLPLTANGKVDRRALPPPEEVVSSSKRPHAGPQTEVGATLAGVWAELLGREEIGPDSNFFELGGHSLLAFQAISRIRETLRLELPLRTLLDRPVLADFTREVEELMRSGAGLSLSPILRVERATPPPLSLGQEGLWLHAQLLADDALYNVPGAVLIKGRLAREALERAINEIVRRHEILRTTFATVEGVPVQVIAPGLSIPLREIDLSGVPRSEYEDRIKSASAEQAGEPFDLTRGPLLRLQLLRFSEDDHALVLTMHHIITDEWSLRIFVNEAAVLYAAFLNGQDSPLPHLPIQYADYAAWQRGWLKGEILKQSLSYWGRQLAGAEPLQLPVDHPRSQVQGHRGDVFYFSLTQEQTGALKTLSKKHQTTLFTVLLAALQILLYRRAMQEDIIVSCDVANRDRIETEGLIGFFVNQLMIRVSFSGVPSFLEVLQRIRRSLFAALAHQHLPVTMLMNKLRLERDLSGSPLARVGFGLRHIQTIPSDLAGLELTEVDVHPKTSRLDLMLVMEEKNGQLGGALRYNTDLFEGATIAAMAAQFQRLVASVTAAPDMPVHRLAIDADAQADAPGEGQGQSARNRLEKLASGRRRSVALSDSALIRKSFFGNQSMPLVIEPALRGVDLIGWARASRDFIDQMLAEHGAILFRGFDVNSPLQFEDFAGACCTELFGQYGDLPRESAGGNIYGSTPYPPDKTILFHNESSHLHQWPMKQFFFCAEPARKGGETPILSSRLAYKLIDPAIIKEFEEKGLMYVRNFTQELDVSWQDFFRTSDRQAVEAYCEQAGIEGRWTRHDTFQTRCICPAVERHPKTNDTVFFNQIQLHHFSCVEDEVRRSLLSLFTEENLPRNVYYGDGSAIDPATMWKVGEVYQEIAVCFQWNKGDILMLDNMLTAHGRNPYVGARKILVAMGDMMGRKNLGAR